MSLTACQYLLSNDSKLLVAFFFAFWLAFFFFFLFFAFHYIYIYINPIWLRASYCLTTFVFHMLNFLWLLGGKMLNNTQRSNNNTCLTKYIYIILYNFWLLHFYLKNKCLCPDRDLNVCLYCPELGKYATG